MSKFTFQRHIVEVDVEGKTFHLDMDRDISSIMKKYSEQLIALGNEYGDKNVPDEIVFEISKKFVNDIFDDTAAYDMIFENVEPNMYRIRDLMEYIASEITEYKEEFHTEAMNRAQRRAHERRNH